MLNIRRDPRFVSFLGFVVMVLLWGSFPVVAKIGVAYVPPLLLSGARFCLAFCILAGVAVIQRKTLAMKRRQHFQVFMISLLMVGIPSSIFFAAAPYAPAGVLTLMWSTTPIFTSLFSIGVTGEARGWRLLCSLCLGMLGILIVLLGHIPFWPGAEAQEGQIFASNGAALIGELAVLGSSVVYGLGMRTARTNSPDVPVLVLTCWQLLYSGLFITLMGLLFERGYPFSPNWIALAALLYLAIFCSCISFFLTFWLIRRIGAIRTAYSDFIIPAVTLVLSYLFLGESLTLAKVGGMLLVMVSILLVAV
ncbi:MAG TPA: DMT family transporter [Ktedonobacteraceae bacterium]|nr:DMT family transporter [Ktedonobacteraceae bacterium]